MVFCRGCGKQIHETARTCPGCGAPQKAAEQDSDESDGPLWRPIATLVIGILTLSPFADRGRLDHDTTVGIVIFGFIGVVLGGWLVSQQRHGRWLTITGVVLSALGLLALLGRS